jgi:hypothetical protein
MKKLSKVLLVVIICGLFTVGIITPVKAQMMGEMQPHMGMKIGMQKMTDGAIILKAVFNLVDEGADITKMLPMLKEANKMIQEGSEMVAKAQKQAAVQPKPAMQHKMDNGGKMLQKKKTPDMNKRHIKLHEVMPPKKDAEPKPVINPTR